MDRHALLEARAELAQGIRASEDWHPSYKSQETTFRALLRYEAQLDTQTAEYLAGLALRAPEYVDWAQVPTVHAAATPLANKADEVWGNEMIDMTKAVIDAITMLTVTGGQFGELTYNMAIGTSSLSDWVLESARTQTAKLVTQVTDTNRKLISEAIKQSVARGEDKTATMARISEVINNPVRAEMIAHTESVNAYQGGLLGFGRETGATKKTYEALAGACPICAPLDGETVGIDETFSNGVDRPPSHPRCRCNTYIVY